MTMPRWSTRDLVLAGSVAANLVLLGFLVGAGVRLAGPGAPGPTLEAVGGPSPRGLMLGLSDDVRAAVREEMIEEGRRSASIIRAIRDARADLETAVTAEPFDDEGARAALERQREARDELQERGDALMVRIWADLPQEQRVEAIRQMNEFSRRGFSGGRRDGPDGPSREGRRDAPTRAPGPAPDLAPDQGSEPPNRR